jgi:hypothetical protein
MRISGGRVLMGEKLDSTWAKSSMRDGGICMVMVIVSDILVSEDN